MALPRRDFSQIVLAPLVPLTKVAMSENGQSLGIRQNTESFGVDHGKTLLMR